MGIAARHAAKVDDKGSLVFADSLQWRAAISKHRNRDVWVVVTRQQHMHTMPQRRYYFGVVVAMIAEYTGEERETIHTFLKQQFLPERDIELLDGKHMKVPPSTKLLTVEQETEFIERCRRWAASFLGLSIPDPNEVTVTL